MDSKGMAVLPGVVPPLATRRARWAGLLAVALILGVLYFFVPLEYPATPSLKISPPVCPQEYPLTPQRNGAFWRELTDLYATDAFLTRAVEQLSSAVQIPTETFDEMEPVGVDERWLSRGPFIDHLATAYPLVHTSLKLQKVNTYGLFYTWQGSDTTLKPVLLMGHYDVVPVAPLSADQWTHPPYSGHFDGKFIWGRGSSDDKSSVIETAIEALLERKFAPTRTVVLSFGFDEEAGGYHGAQYLAAALLDRFGPNSFSMIVDEGLGFQENYGTIFALPDIAEKGHLNVEIELQTPGGHSSVPPGHTSIGMLAALIVQLESNAPVPTLQVGSPVFEMAQCFATRGATMPSKLKHALLHAGKSPKALKTAEALLLKDPVLKALIGTTQAVDMITGGVKSNALPEQAWAVVNHRIATQSSVNETLQRDVELLEGLAARFNLSVTANGKLITPAADATYGSLALTTRQELEPAPVTPSNAAPFRLLAGTIRATFHAARKDVREGKTDIVIAPAIGPGNSGASELAS
ncbi:carboxypeptidase S [Mycena alexandri]|uniref:Carboxypeptidase S n=1 Tax=Mycena alexandri TaxID=1745969 RepID=A0AAD6SVK8_9AGAR|nr:carboxypeptidase S [Mycena alexandri]